MYLKKNRVRQNGYTVADALSPGNSGDAWEPKQGNDFRISLALIVMRGEEETATVKW